MPREIGFEEVHLLLGDGAQVVEVLPPSEYEQEHIAGAINIPLKRLTPRSAGALDASRPVVVYCWDDA